MPDSVAKAQILTDEALELIAARFRALGEPSRLKLIRALLGGEKSVGRLTELARLTQANTSRHLQTLTEAGILGRRKEGLNVIYFIADQSILGLCQHVCGAVQRRHAGHLEALRPAVGALAGGGGADAPLGTTRIPETADSLLGAEEFKVSFD